MRQVTHPQYQDSYNKEFERTRKSIEENGWDYTRNLHIKEHPRGTPRSEISLEQFYKGCAQIDALHKHK